MYLKFDFVSIFGLLIVLISLFFSIQLYFFSIFKRITNKYLSLYFLLFTVIFLYHFLTRIPEIKRVASMYFLPIYPALVLALLPTMFLYIISANEYNNSLKKWKKHYLPSLIFLGISLVSLFVFKLKLFHSFTLLKIYGYFLFFSVAALFPIQNIIYYKKFLNLYRSLNHESKNVFADEKQIISNWLKIFILGYVVFFCLVVVNEASSSKYSNYILYIVMISYILYIGITSNIKIKLLYQPLVEAKVQENLIEDIKSDEFEHAEKVDNSIFISEEKVIEIKTKVMKMIEVDKVYLNQNLSIIYFAKRLNTNYKYISQVINKEFDKNFFTLINEYRINYAKNLLSNSDNDILTIEALAEKAGFNSKSAFNNAFKKYTGVTPKEFKKESRV